MHCPNAYVTHFSHITVDWLKAHHIRVLCCDIDNTLVASHDPDANVEVKTYIDRIRKEGIKVVLLSNATKQRANRFSSWLKVDAIYALSLKPLPTNLWRVKKRFKVKNHEIALMGDQVFTDYLATRLAGVVSILVKPISNKDKVMTILSRQLEKLVFRSWAKQGLDRREDRL